MRITGRDRFRPFFIKYFIIAQDTFFTASSYLVEVKSEKFTAHFDFELLIICR